MPRFATCLLLSLFLTAAAADAQSWTRVSNIPAAYTCAVAGEEEFFFAATDSVVYRSLDGGVYPYRLHAGSAARMGKLLLLR